MRYVRKNRKVRCVLYIGFSDINSTPTPVGGGGSFVGACPARIDLSQAILRFRRFV